MLSPERIEKLMGKCISAAYKHGEGVCKPYAGAIVLGKDEEEILGIGIKSLLGGSLGLTIHAERDALVRAGRKANGGTLITTLEPCVRIPGKRTILKSCAEFILESGIKRVVIGMQDPTFTLKGKGISYLKQNRIETMLYKGPQGEEIRKLFHRYLY